MTDLRIGLLGCGRIGQMHAELIARRVDGAALSAVYDVVSDTAAHVATGHGARVVASATELIEADDVDAVAICSSADTHVDLLVEAARSAKPVFVEKPLALDLADADRGVAAVAPGSPVQVGFNRRFDASHRLVRDRVAAGDVGEVHLVRITSRDPEPPPADYLVPPGGIFVDMTIHDFDMARFVTASEVVEVYATGAVRIDPARGPADDLDTAVIVLTHENGAITAIDNSRQAVYGYDQRVEAFGSGGMVAAGNPPTTTTTYHGPGRVEASPLPHFFLERYIPSYVSQWAGFVAMAVRGEPTPVSVHDGRAALIIALAAWRSAREQRPVPIEGDG